MTALPFRVHLSYCTKNSFRNETTSQSGSYEHGTISLLEGSAARAKRHYPEKIFYRKIDDQLK
jgi:hypothetical protein